MEQRLSALFGPARPASPPARRTEARPGAGRGGWRPGFGPQGPRLGIAGQPLPRRADLAGKPGEAPRDIVILAILLNHPGLLDRHIEEIAALDLSHRALAAFRDQLLARALDPPARAPPAEGSVFAQQRARILRRASQMPVWWCVREEADPSDADQVLRQTLALHRKARALNRELNLAEKALAIEAAPEINEQNFGMLRDIKENLADLADAEAAIDGFGALSGRKLPPV